LIAIYQQKKLKYPIQISTYIILISLWPYTMPSEVQKSFKALALSINLMSIDLLYGKFGMSFLKFLCMRTN
jgi:hypothetical protein